MEFVAKPPVIRPNPMAITNLINNSPQKDEQMRRIAEDMKAVAQRTYNSLERGEGTGATRDSFVAFSHRGRWVISLQDPKSVWVESGAHARGTTPILGYRPMRAAMDHAENQARGSFLPSGILSPRM